MGKTSFLNAHKENINNGGKRKVAIFIGCLGNYNYRQVGDSLLTILKHLEIDAFLGFIPPRTRVLPPKVLMSSPMGRSSVNWRGRRFLPYPLPPEGM